MTADELKALIRSVPDFPKPGILFRDVTTLIGHGRGFAAAVTLLAEQALKLRAELAVIAEPSLLPALQSALGGSGVRAAAGAEAGVIRPRK